MSILSMGQGGLLSSGGYMPNSIHSFPEPWLDMASTAMPETMQLALRWCVLPGTPIELADLSLKPIEKIQAGDGVLTRGGTHERVVCTSNRPYRGEIVEFCFDGLGNKLPLRVTTNHNVWRIRTPRLKPNRCNISLDNAEKVQAGDVQVGDYFATPLPKRGPRKTARFHGWLLGMYLAEGCMVRDDGKIKAVKFTLGQKDEELGIVQRLAQEIADGTGKWERIYTPPSRPDVRTITSCDAELPDWCFERGGEYSGHKCLSEEVLSYSDETILDIIGGWIDGDGCTDIRDDNFKCVTAVTTSYNLAYQLQRLANCVGMTPSLSQRKIGKFNNHEEFSSFGYALSFGKKDYARLAKHSLKVANALVKTGSCTNKKAGKRGCFIADGYVFRRVNSVKRVEYDGPVHNFEVANDHSYIAGGVTVSNCEFIVQANGTYFRALDRVLAYFITDIEIEGSNEDGIDDKKKEEIYDYLMDEIGILDQIHIAGLNYMVYGNNFTSLLVPFRRYLSCRKCHLELQLKQVVENDIFKFTWADFDFNATCPRCQYSGVWDHIDRRGGSESQLIVKHWSPHEMELLWDPYTDDVKYIWKIPEDYRKCIREGKLFHLERANWEIIQAVKNNRHLLFSDDIVYHMKEATLAGIRNRGWGISRVLSNFRQAWYVQVLHRYNEAIALDYVIPFRLITPAPGPGSGDQARDTLLNLNMGGYMGAINRMLAKRRRDPAGWHTLPFPVQYQALGGDANQLAPRDLLDQGLEVLLNNVGVPVELYKGSLQTQAAPAALRLFESQWSHLTHVLNGYVNFIMRRVGMLQSWEHVTAKLVKVTHADDLQRSMAKLQLMMGGQISKETGLATIGVKFRDETRRKNEEAEFEAEQQEKSTERMEQKATMSQMGQPQQPGMPAGAPGMPPGGDPSQGGDPTQGTAYAGAIAAQPTQPTQPTTPQEMQQKANQLAQQILAMPESQKDSELIQLKKSDPTMHSLVTSLIEDIRRKAQTAGGAQVMAQQFGKQGMALPRWLFKENWEPIYPEDNQPMRKYPRSVLV